MLMELVSWNSVTNLFITFELHFLFFCYLGPVMLDEFVEWLKVNRGESNIQ
jgi:hypothetical protein